MKKKSTHQKRDEKMKAFARQLTDARSWLRMAKSGATLEQMAAAASTPHEPVSVVEAQRILRHYQQNPAIVRALSREDLDVLRIAVTEYDQVLASVPIGDGPVTLRDEDGECVLTTSVLYVTDGRSLTRNEKPVTEPGLFQRLVDLKQNDPLRYRETVLVDECVGQRRRPAPAQ